MSLALLVLFSTFSFTVEKHYCGGHLIDVSLFSKAENCGMSSMEMLQKKSCCKDEVDVVEGQDELKLSPLEDLDLKQQQFTVVFAIAYFSLFEDLPKSIIPHKEYSPPNLVCDIQVLDQVFLI